MTKAKFKPNSKIRFQTEVGDEKEGMVIMSIVRWPDDISYDVIDTKRRRQTVYETQIIEEINGDN